MAKSQQNFDFSKFEPINSREIRHKTEKMPEILLSSVWGCEKINKLK
jgi:hypothetical protein